MTASFLPPGASVSQRIRAAAENHTAWFAGKKRQTNGVIWKDDAPKEIVIAFPKLTPETAGETLDAIIGEGRTRGVKSIACWSLSPTKPRDLGARLAARGFEWGWQPHWMSLDLDALGDENKVNGLKIEIDNDANWDVDDLPYYTRKTAAPSDGRSDCPATEVTATSYSKSPSGDSDHSSKGSFESAQADFGENVAVTSVAGQSDGQKFERRFHFGAWLDGQIAGHCVVFLNAGKRGVAGIYNVGVVPEMRRRGIGRAVTLGACRFARDLGAHYALLNAAAPELYAQCGFVSLGFGQTWWMHADALAALPPSSAEIIFAEAVGRGDVKFLDAFSDIPADLDAPLASNFSPLTLAVRAEKPMSVRWLLRHGATLSARSGSRQTTPLHDAVLDGDVKLLRLLLSFRPDRQTLELRDAEYDGTPLSWARHLGEDECAAVLEEYAANLG